MIVVEHFPYQPQDRSKALESAMCLLYATERTMSMNYPGLSARPTATLSDVLLQQICQETWDACSSRPLKAAPATRNYTGRVSLRNPRNLESC